MRERIICFYLLSPSSTFLCPALGDPGYPISSGVKVHGARGRRRARPSAAHAGPEAEWQVRGTPGGDEQNRRDLSGFTLLPVFPFFGPIVPAQCVSERRRDKEGTDKLIKSARAGCLEPPSTKDASFFLLLFFCFLLSYRKREKNHAPVQKEKKDRRPSS